jgi:hypothetical protein
MAWHHDGVAAAGAGIPSGLGMQSASTAIEAPARTIVASRDEPPARDDAREPPICADIALVLIGTWLAHIWIFGAAALRLRRAIMSVAGRGGCLEVAFCPLG